MNTAVPGFCPLIVIAMMVAVLTGCATESQMAAQSEQQFSEMRQSMPISTDTRARNYVFCVANAIIAQLEEPYRSYPWDIEVFESEQVNAFAMPGGKIGVFTGILDVAATRDQLGAVIGHEVAHVTQEHARKRYDRAVWSAYGAQVAGTLDDIILERDIVGAGEAQIVGATLSDAAVWTQSGKRSRHRRACVLDPRRFRSAPKRRSVAKHGTRRRRSAA